MKKISCIVVILITWFSVTAQNELKVSFYTGYGSYQFSDLKDLQKELINNIPELPIKATEEFPAYINYMGIIEYSISEHVLLGINGAFYSTGARNHAKDYSGEYKLDMLASSYRIGLNMRYIFKKSNNLYFYGKVSGGPIFSAMKVEESFFIFEEELLSSKDKFNATSYFAEPSVGSTLNLTAKFSLDLNLGYQIDFGGDLHQKGDKDAHLYNMNGEKLSINWSGVRLSLGLTYKLF